MWQDLACLPVTPADKNHVTPSIPTPKPQAKIRPWHIAAGITLTVGIAFAGFQLGVRNGNRSDSTPSTRNEENQQKQQENDVRQEETTTSEQEAYIVKFSSDMITKNCITNNVLENTDNVRILRASMHCSCFPDSDGKRSVY